MKFEDVIRKREAVRKFKDESISEEELGMILEAGRLAPTAKNNQPIKIIVVKSKEGIEIIDEASPCRYNAPIVLVICGNKDECFTNGMHNTLEIDASIVATHMMLEATNVGVDNIWIDMFDRDILKNKLNLESNIIPISLLPLGYRSDDYEGNPRHNIRKNIEDIVEYK